MTNISLYPMQDYYETKLSQSYNWWTWTMYVKATPTFTFPSWMKTAVVINPWKTTQQVVIIDWYNASNKTLNVSSVSVNRWPWLAYTAQTHPINSVVRISNSFAFFEAITNAINSKVNTNDSWMTINWYANETARDAAITSPVSGKNWAYINDRWLFTKYIAWSWQDDSTWATANASVTSAGKVEEWTVAQGKAWTTTWETWARLFLNPASIADIVQSWAWLYAWASAAWTDTYVVSMTPACTAYVTGMEICFKADVANTGACTINVNGLGAKSIKLLDWNDPSDWQIAANQFVALRYDWTNFIYIAVPTVSTSAMVTAWVNQSNFVTPYLLRAFANPYTISAWSTTITSATTSQNITAASYTKYKEIQATIDWTYTVEFTLLWVNGRNTFWRIYKNGVAVWTERNTSSAVWDQIYSENLSFVAWDLIQIYCYRNNVDFTPYVKNFYLKATISQNTALVSGNVILN